MFLLDIVEQDDDEQINEENICLNKSNNMIKNCNNSLNHEKWMDTLVQTKEDTHIFEDDDRIYESKIDYNSVGGEVINDINNFISEMLFLTELGKNQIFNFLLDVSQDLDRLHRNINMLQNFCYKEYFVLWLSPAVAHKILSDKENKNKFLLRTSTTLAGYYTFSFRKSDNVINHLRVRGSEVMEKLSKIKKLYSPIKINPIYKDTSIYHIGYITEKN